MIKEKLSQFLAWIKDHCLFLLEVLVRLSVGIEKKENQEQTGHSSDDDQKGESA